MSISEAQVVRDGFPRPTPNIPSNVLEQFRMDGKVIVVNGAADGIGAAVAEGMAEAGGNVALWYNSYVFALFSVDFWNDVKGRCVNGFICMDGLANVIF